MDCRQLDMFSMNPNCPFVGLHEDADDKCYSLLEKSNYEEISEDHPQFPNWLAEIGGVLFENKIAEPTPLISLPPFFPTVNRGGKGLITGSNEPIVGITLGDVVSLKKLAVATNIRSVLGLSPKTKLVLLSFGKDELIENMWPERHKVYEQLQRLGFDLVTSINYSVWFCQTHSEHLINVKRNWLTFHEMQKFGLPAIPNIYWYGRKDLARWVEWLNNNPQVKTASINLQTLRTSDSWNTVTDLEFLAEHLDHKIQFLVDGPTTPERIELIKKILPSVSFTNKFCFSTAASGFMVNQDKKSLIKHHSLIPKPHIFRKNSEFYKNLSSSLISEKSSFDIFGSSFEV